MPSGVTKDDMFREICARAEDFAERWVHRRRSGLDRDRLVTEAVYFVEEALCDLGSKEARRLALGFETVLVHVMLTADRKEASHDRIAPMTPLDEASEAIDARSAARDPQSDMQRMIDFDRAMSELKKNEPRIYAMLEARLRSESNKSIAGRHLVSESRIRHLLAKAVKILRSRLDGRPDDDGNPEGGGK